MKPRFLITGFEPFGPRRGRLLKRNASLDVLRLLRPALDRRYRTAVLAVSDAGIRQLETLLDGMQPEAVVMMGEARLYRGGAVHIEPLAVGDSTGGGEVAVPSPCAQRLIKRRRQPPVSRIGRYYCNRAYLTALNWSRNNGKTPVVFVHIAVDGNRRQQARQLAEVLGMLRKPHPSSKPSPHDTGASKAPPP